MPHYKMLPPELTHVESSALVAVVGELGSFEGSISVSFWGHLGGSFRGHFGVTWGSLWGQCGVSLGATLGVYFGVTWGQFLKAQAVPPRPSVQVRPKWHAFRSFPPKGSGVPFAERALQHGEPNALPGAWVVHI